MSKKEVVKNKVKGNSKKKVSGKKSTNLNTRTIDTHPRLLEQLTFGQRASDVIAKFGGSWTFISIFFVFLFGWMCINTWWLLKEPFDPYPYILLNLTLSCLAAIQAPIILMAQNRQAEWDHVDARYDHAVNRKAEREIKDMQKELKSIKRLLQKLNSK